MSEAKQIAVLSGDLIKSRAASPAALAAAFATLEAAAQDFGSEWSIDLRFTRFRGDGWQVVLTEPRLWFDALLYLTARLRAGSEIETRISAACGGYDTLGSSSLADASGPAFFISGDHLDHMSPKRKFAYAESRDNITWKVALLDLAEFISAGWTATQAQAVASALLGAKTHAEIASELDVTRQAVQSRLSGAGFSYFDNARYAISNKSSLKSTEAP